MIRKLFFWVLLIALILLSAFSDKLFPPETIYAETARVTDGDTLILNGTAYRLYGIDAPEYRQSCKDAGGRDWPCGKAARLQLAAHTVSGSIVCETRAADRNMAARSRSAPARRFRIWARRWSRQASPSARMSAARHPMTPPSLPRVLKGADSGRDRSRPRRIGGRQTREQRPLEPRDCRRIRMGWRRGGQAVRRRFAPSWPAGLNEPLRAAANMWPCP